jgi:hypothetical protein
VEDWQREALNKYSYAKDLTLELLPDLWLPLEFAISVRMILKIKGWTLPFMGVILGAPSSLKTQSLDLTIDYPNTFTTDEFTPASFVSHNSGKSEQELQKIDLLPRIVNKVCIFPELAPLFTSKDEDLSKNFGKIIRLLDGQGFQSDSGGQGHRGYSGQMTFVILGAAVEVPFRVYRLFGNLGQKIYFLRLPRIEKSKEQRKESAKQKNDFKTIISRIKEAVIEYLVWMDAAPGLVAKLDKDDFLRFEWNSKKEDEPEQDTALGHIVELCELLANLRGVVNTYEHSIRRNAMYDATASAEKNLNTREDLFENDFAIREDPQRAIAHLKSLAMGHAISQARNYLSSRDIPIVIKTALSSAPIARVRIFDLLLQYEGELTTSSICRELKISPHTAQRAMTELYILEIAELHSLSKYSNSELKIKLMDKFSWFLSTEFEELREGFRPGDYTKLRYRTNISGPNLEISQDAKSKTDDIEVACDGHTNEDNLTTIRNQNNLNESDSREQLHNLYNEIIIDHRAKEPRFTATSDNFSITKDYRPQSSNDIELDNNENVPERGGEICSRVTQSLEPTSNSTANIVYLDQYLV